MKARKLLCYQLFNLLSAFSSSVGVFSFAASAVVVNVVVERVVFLSSSGAVTAMTRAPSGAVMTIDRTATVSTCPITIYICVYMYMYICKCKLANVELVVMNFQSKLMLHTAPVCFLLRYDLTKSTWAQPLEGASTK